MCKFIITFSLVTYTGIFLQTFQNATSKLAYILVMRRQIALNSWEHIVVNVWMDILVMERIALVIILVYHYVYTTWFIWKGDL